MNAPMNTMAPRTKHPKSYGDLDDKEDDVNGQGCLQPVLALAALAIVALAGCAAIGPCKCPPDVDAVFTLLSAP